MTAFRHGARAMLALAWLLASSLLPAGVPLPLPVPAVMPLTTGAITAILRLPDGSIVIGGSFSSVDNVARANLARITPQGTLDEAWHPALDNVPYGLALDPSSGAVYVAGSFTTVDGQPQPYVARLSADGALDPSWHPALNNMVQQVAVDPVDGDVYIGGAPGWRIDGQFRGGLARIGASGVLDPWEPVVHGLVQGFAFDWANHAVYAGGQFDRVGSSARHGLAKISLVDAAVDPDWKPEPNLGIVDTVQLDAARRLVYVGGQFQSIGGAARNRIARLDADGTGAADAWNPSADGEVRQIALDPVHASVYATGTFQNIGGRAGTVAKLADSGSGAADPGWSVFVNLGAVRVLSLDAASGHLTIAGQFTNVGAIPRLAYAELDGAGAASGSRVDFERPGIVSAVAGLPDHSVLIGGSFVKVGRADRRYLVRIRADGALDPAWAPDVDNLVLAIEPVPADDAVYIGGAFSKVAGVFRRCIAKLPLGGSGVPDPVWNPAPDNEVTSIVPSADGSTLYVGGAFTRFGTVSHLGLAKISTSGTGAADPAWTPSADNLVLSLALDASGEALDVGGWFTHIGITPRGRLARIDAGGTGALDASWNPSADASVTVLLRGADDTLYVGGRFNAIGGVARSRIVRLDPAGVPDPDWNPGADNDVSALALSPDGTAIHLGGSFATVGGVARPFVARVSTSAGAAIDAGWNPTFDATVGALAIGDGGATLLAGGNFTRVGDEPHGGVAALPLPGSYATTSAIVGFDPASAIVGEPVAVEASVTSEDGTPAGDVSIGDGTATCVATLDASGTGSCELVFAHAGAHALTASYAGAGDFAGSTSASAPYAVSPAATTLSIVSDAPDPSLPGEPVTVTVALAVVAPGAGTPVGDIIVGDGVDACTVAGGASSCDLALTARGPHTLTATFEGDADFLPSSGTATHAVNRLPDAAADAYATGEDHALTVDASNGVLGNDADADGDTLVVTSTGSFAASGIGGSVTLAADGSLSYAPPPDANGVATFEYTVSDGLESATATVTIAVAAINDAPVPGPFANRSWPAGTTGAQSIPGFATVLAFGPPDEAGQHVLAWHVRTIADDAGVLAGDVTIDADGTLHATLSGNAGSATLGVTLQDDGGTDGGGTDTSAESVFTVSVDAPLDAIFANGFDPR